MSSRRGLKLIGPGVYDTGKYLIVKTTDVVERYLPRRRRPIFVSVTYWSVFRKNVKSKPIYRGLTIRNCRSILKSAS